MRGVEQLTAKEYLFQAKNLDDYINAKTAEAAQLRSRIMRLQGISYDGVHVSGGAKHDFTDTINSLIRLEQYIDAQVDKLVDLRKEIGDQIGRIGDNRFRAVLTRYYLCNERFETIAKKMGYSLIHIKRLHGLALNDFRKIYSEN